ncbi:hypothetical protein BJ546DRAFT_92562 [Cryomyces antarcticus]|uniref:Uncharacterized protein n=1 Tax=Cryomyces antarcticus TaxID=329879 RepID=A0ABR0M876_9PEZI|nr:hypothetical protein LTR39_001789 [Cryomyces antarcticus]KAK5017278.1 hypothetical protein LTR60_002009 [Cryomyces antarcticus]KAK5172438.1 hypothetical protein LTR04_005072 [Oleoguttula sp. CCFEE 6159]KAK5292455.1 hypothetical protein LTR16_001895 [Cryomyces antarcticus]
MFHREFEDEWYDNRFPARRVRRPSPHHSSSDFRHGFLDPNMGFGTSLHRSRSYGHAPIPQVNVYNEVIQDAQQRAEQRSPALADPRGRRSVRLGDELIADELAELRIDLRARSRGRSDAAIFIDRSRDNSPAYLQWQLLQAQKEATDAAQRRAWEKEQEKKQTIAQWNADQAAKSKEQAEARQKAIDDYEKKKIKDAEEMEAWRERIAKEARDKKAKEEREYQEFLRKQKEKEEKAKAEKKEEEEKLERAMKDRLARFGFQNNQIEAMVDPKKAERLRVGATPATAMALWDPVRQPVYAKVHRQHLDVDTLLYYNIPYEYDKLDRDYIIILREMDKHQTEVLFEHTRRLRKGALLVEPKKAKPEYAWVRKRERSKSKGREKVRTIGVTELFRR